MKRLFDFTASGLVLIALSPISAVLDIWIKADSKSIVSYRQTRVGCKKVFYFSGNHS
ncbi:MAG: sugar transferase [Muribaculaceae bacterium]|nr:sugar transferase [Muribaculaceae bacterium]